MSFGLLDEELAYLVTTVVRPLSGQGARVFCFGSRARGDHHPFSDLDLLVESPPEREAALSLALSTLAETLEESNFPYKVDLVTIQDLATDYRARALAERIEILPG